MGVRIEEVPLPGIGVRYDVLTASGRRVSVVSHRDGKRDLALYDLDDPDASRDLIPMTDEEASALAELLGASVMLSRLTGLRDHAVNLFTEQLWLPADSPFVNRPLGHTKARRRTGASIVAIVRGTEIIPSPTPAEVFNAGDLIVAVGTRDGLDALGNILASEPT